MDTKGQAGNVDDFLALLAEIGRQNLTLKLLLLTTEGSAEMHIQKGALTKMTSDPQRSDARLGTMLVKANKISPVVLIAMLEFQEKKHHVYQPRIYPKKQNQLLGNSHAHPRPIQRMV